jgi:hypothetical protein
MNLRAAAQQALEQEGQEPVAWMYVGLTVTNNMHGPHLVWKPEQMDAMSAEKGVVASPLYTHPPRRETEHEQEPVAWIHRQGNHWDVSERILTDDEKARGWTEEPLYTHPPRREPLTVTELQQALVDADLVDPDAIDDPDRYDAGSTVAQIDALHSRLMQTTPPRREWQSLTEEEIIRLVHGVLEKPINYCEPAAWQLAGGITRAVEQALKERNT